MRPPGDTSARARPIIPILLGCLVLAALSLLLPSTLTFDPFSWASWAREIVHFDLDTANGPSWKPLPVLVNVAFSPLGHIEEVWLVVARTGALLAVVMTYRLGARLAGRWAGLIAAAGMVLSAGFVEYLTPLGMSEPLLAGLALLALEKHLDGRYEIAHGLLFAALLLRLEVLPFFALYSVFVWVRRPGVRPWIVLAVVLIPVLWLLPDQIGSGNWRRSSERAQLPIEGGPLVADNPGLAVLDGGLDSVLPPILLGAAVATALAGFGYVRRRQDGLTLVLAAGAAAWVGEVVVLTQARQGAGEQRYLIVGVALTCVLAGAGWVRLARVTAAAAARPSGAGRLIRLLPVGVVTVGVLGSAPFVATRLDDLCCDGGIQEQVDKYDELARVIEAAGGRDRIMACGPIGSNVYQMPALAWILEVHQSQIAVEIEPTGTVFRTRNTLGAPLLPDPLGSPAFRLVASTEQWEVLSTCPPAEAVP